VYRCVYGEGLSLSAWEGGGGEMDACEGSG
jgi:hypothetical protein